MTRIQSINVIAEPMGNGYQAHLNGDPCFWGRGDSIDEAIGSAIRNHCHINIHPSAARLLARHQEEALDEYLRKAA